MISFSDACFAMIDSSSAYSEFRADFGLSHAVHIAVQNSRFQSGKFWCAYKDKNFEGLPFYV